MILVALIKAFQNHIGFAIIRASAGKDWERRYHDATRPPNGLGSGPERVKRRVYVCVDDRDTDLYTNESSTS